MLHRVQQLISLRDFRPFVQHFSAPLAAYLHTLPATEEGPAASTPSKQQGQHLHLGEALDELLGSNVETGWVPEEQQLLVQAAIVGVPNSGKSTLTNALVGQKVSAVSAKTNTTAYSRLGAFTEGAAQVVLYDTPGVVGSQHYKNPRHERRVKSAWTVAGDCDLLLFILDAHRQLVQADPRVEKLLSDFGSGANLGLGSEGAGWAPPPSLLIMNKVDAVPRGQRAALLPLADRLRRLCSSGFEEVFWVSALKGQGVSELREYLLGRATPGRWSLEPDAATDRSEEEMALEVVRENIFRRFYEGLPYALVVAPSQYKPACSLGAVELPYELVVAPISHKPLADGSVRVEHHILVDSERLKKIVVGKNGAAIGVVGRSARLELERLWKRRVHLILEVKVMRSSALKGASPDQ
ncbi:hypothetical protein N2152v2_001295 [Parachlorella kessleri]